MRNKVGNKIKNKKTTNDKIYTPLPVALKMIEMCNIKPTDKILDCSKGAGVFYNNLPKCEKYWCEIDEDIVGNNKRDFFEFKEKVDLIIGNPPYSLWNEWIEHTLKITDKFCYIMGVLNLTDARIRKILNNGFGLTHIHILKVEWWFGNHFICIFEKNKPSIMSVCEKRIYCDICNNSKCQRGKNGNLFNICSMTSDKGLAD